MLPMGQYKIVVNILGKCYNTENNENEAIGILLHILDTWLHPQKSIKKVQYGSSNQEKI